MKRFVVAGFMALAIVAPAGAVKLIRRSAHRGSPLSDATSYDGNRNPTFRNSIVRPVTPARSGGKGKPASLRTTVFTSRMSSRRAIDAAPR